MIDLSNYSCDKCIREFSRHCKHCYHTIEKPPTRFKPKKKTGVQTPEFRSKVPMPPIKPAKEKENATMNKTMYGLNLYIPFEELDAYIHEHIDKNYGDLTFVPVKVEVNDIDLSIDIRLLSASSVEIDNCRYKIDLNKMAKENGK